MDTTAFYATTAAACFTLLGFWWVIVEFRHAALTREAGPRRFAFVVSLQFVLPGLASLASLLASGPVWRVVFAAMAVTGSAAAVLGVRALGGTLVALRALALASLPLDAFFSDGYSFLVEMLFVAHRRGCRIAEVPITFVERREGESKVSRAVLLESAVTPWRLISNPESSRKAPRRTS